MKIDQSTLKLTLFLLLILRIFISSVLASFLSIFSYRSLHFQGLKTDTISGASDLVQLTKVFAVKPGDLSLVPRIHVVEGENQLTQVVL